jgi:hypothetical protein
MNRETHGIDDTSGENEEQSGYLESRRRGDRALGGEEEDGTGVAALAVRCGGGRGVRR